MVFIFSETPLKLSGRNAVTHNVSFKPKKIAIVGAGSFIARSIADDFKDSKHIFEKYDRASLDLKDLKSIKKAFEGKFYDLVIHCGMSGHGRLLNPDSPENFYENVLMQENLLFLHEHYKNIILFSSGAQNSRDVDVLNLKEGEFRDPPNDFYSLAKFVNSKRSIGNNKVINLRIFNVFGILEKPDRFIKTNILKYIRKENMEIWGDKMSDFFYVRDVSRVVEHFICNPTPTYSEINLVYEGKKLLLSQIAEKINETSTHKVELIIKNGVNRHYTGNGEVLPSLNLPLTGLDQGLREMYERLINEPI